MRRIFFALTLSLPLLANYTEVEDQSTLQISTPSLQDVERAKLRLSNGLEAYIISDPNAEQSAAALVVEAGSNNEPDTRPGLAHFVEHMVFMGSETYPEEDQFQQFASDNGGHTNAFTQDHATSYLFSIEDEAFPEAIDQWAHFFVDPLFREGTMAREQKAVHSEFVRGSEEEYWRTHHAEKAISNPSHPASRFSFGNLQTLEGASQEEVDQWFKENYSANLMHLVVYSSLPMSQLKQVVDKSFSKIPNRNLERFVPSEPQLGETGRTQTLYVRPRKDERQLNITWEIPYDYASDIETHAGDVIAYAIGHEGKTSLLAQLKREGLAEELGASASGHRMESERYFQMKVQIALTPKGVKEYRHVVKRTFQYLAGLKQTGIPSHLHDERNKMQQLAYQFQTRQPSYDTVEAHIRAIYKEPLQTYPQKQLIADRFDKATTEKILKQMTPANVHITLIANNSESGGRTPNKEPWMEVEYGLEGPTGNEYSAWDQAIPHPNMKPPEENPYVPTDLEVVHRGEVSNTLPQPNLIADSGYGQIYYARDTQFHVPQIVWNFVIKSEAVIPSDPTAAVLTDLMVKTISERLNETAYSAKVAGLGFNIGPHEDGITLTVAGYSDKAKTLFKEILKGIAAGAPTQEEFDQYRHSVTTDYQNFSKEQPIKQALEVTRLVLLKEGVPTAEKAQVASKITRDQLVDFFEAFRHKTFVEGILFGNMTQSEAEEISRLLRTQYQVQPYPAGKERKPEVVHLPTSKGPHYIIKSIKSQGNAIVLTIQEGPFTFKRRAAQEILSKAIDAPFFTELRSNQQTGYVVKAWGQELERQLFQFFGVQSNTHAGEDLRSRFELFLENFLRDLKESSLTPERFETIRQAQIAKLKQPPKSPAEMGAYLMTIAFKHDADWKWREQRIQGLQELTYPEFVVLANEYLGRTNKRRFAVIAQGKLNKEESLKYKRSRSPNRLKRVSTYAPRN